MKDSPEDFKNLDIPRKTLAEAALVQYRVYSSAKDFVLVNAENAQMAIAQSGLSEPLRVVRHIPTQCNVLEFPMQAAEAKAAPQAPQAEAPEETARPLSSEDVESLLKND